VKTKNKGCSSQGEEVKSRDETSGAQLIQPRGGILEGKVGKKSATERQGRETVRMQLTSAENASRLQRGRRALKDTRREKYETRN